MLDNKLGNERFSIVFIDCDLYGGTKYALVFIYHRKEQDAIICFHDYYPPGYRHSLWGITKAVNEFLQKNQLIRSVKDDL